MSTTNIKLLNRLLDVIEFDIIPLTTEGVKNGNKIFGGAILKKSDYSLVVAGTNLEIENPLWHGEMATIKKLYELPSEKRILPKDCIFLSTHEPCSMCLSAITWGGYDNFYYFFSYEQTKDAFNIPHDLKILDEVFDCKEGNYSHENAFWKSNNLIQMIEELDNANRTNLKTKVIGILKQYDQLSSLYQASKSNNNIPLG